jgi:hypothetical protein
VSELSIIGDRRVAKFDPKKTKENLSLTSAGLQHAKNIKDWEMLGAAVDFIIAEQREFVTWWREKVRRPGGDHSCSDAGMLSDEEDRERKRQSICFRGKPRKQDVLKEAGIPFHELANILPPLDGEKLAALVADIAANGLHVPGGNGMSNRKAAKALGVSETTLRGNRAKHAGKPRTNGATRARLSQSDQNDWRTPGYPPRGPVLSFFSMEMTKPSSARCARWQSAECGQRNFNQCRRRRKKGTAGQLVGIFATQIARIEKDMALIEKAKAPGEAAGILQAKDLGTQFTAAKNVSMDLVGTVGAGLITNTGALNALTNGISTLNERLTGLGPYDVSKSPGSGVGRASALVKAKNDAEAARRAYTDISLLHHPLDKLEAQRTMGDAIQKELEAKEKFEAARPVRGGHAYQKQLLGLTGATGPAGPAAELKGEATIKNSLSISLDPGLIAKEVRNQLNAGGNLRGDTGVSMTPANTLPSNTPR